MTSATKPAYVYGKQKLMPRMSLTTRKDSSNHTDMFKIAIGIYIVCAILALLYITIHSKELEKLGKQDSYTDLCLMPLVNVIVVLYLLADVIELISKTYNRYAGRY